MYTSDLREDMELLRSYRDSLYALQLRSSVEYRINAAARMTRGPEKKAAYEKILGEVDRYSPEYARVANYIAQDELDGNAPNLDECKKYLIRSAIVDLYNAQGKIIRSTSWHRFTMMRATTNTPTASLNHPFRMPSPQACSSGWHRCPASTP